MGENPTLPEKQLAQILNELGIEFETQKIYKHFKTRCDTKKKLLFIKSVALMI